MITTTPLRIMRLKYGITLLELEKYSGFSNQYLSSLELGKAKRTPRNEAVLDGAITRIMEARRATACGLQQYFDAHRGHLLETLEAEADEL